MTRSSLFLSQFGEYLESLLTKGGTPLICGDFNFHVEDDLDTVAQQFITLYQDKGFQQHVRGATHIAGGTLDLILTRKNISDDLKVSNISIEPNTGTTSDHYFIQFEIPAVPAIMAKGQTLETKTLREFKKIDADLFKSDIKASRLNSSLSSLDLEEVVDLYETILTELLDKHAPVVSKTFKVKRTMWWNSKCQEARTLRRRAERAFKKSGRHPIFATVYNESCVDAAIIINRERNNYFQTKLSSLAGDARETFKVVNHLLDKEYGGKKFPNGESDFAVAENLMEFFDTKISKIYKTIEKNQCPRYKNAMPPQKEAETRLSEFTEISNTDLMELIKQMPNKSCSSDVIPTWLLKECLPELINVLSFIVNSSILTSAFPPSFKSALVIPSLKKPSLDSDSLPNYRPISNLPFISKVVENVAHKQMVSFLEGNILFAEHQSGYRKGHSCETAITKIHNDIIMMMDDRSSIALMLLDLSAAFDTINHSILLQKLEFNYGITDAALKWISSYLSGRSFRVSVNDSLSSVCTLPIGIPQGSILGPLLFILYTKEIEAIAARYGLHIHLYADDTQVYFAFNVDCPNPDLSAIKDCFMEIKMWMSLNFLKLNDNKTEFMVIGRYETSVKSISLGDTTVPHTAYAKNLGFVFDDQMSLDKHISSVSQKCFMHLRNLRRIGSKLTLSLKIQLVHSFILSSLDYCNPVFAALTEVNLNKLQKIQNAAVRFIFDLRGKECHEPISPYLKKLHFLPVRYRIQYKICHLVFKCLNDIAPTYLKDLIPTRQRNMQHHTRLNDDSLILQTTSPKTTKTMSAFSVSAPNTWNSLPYKLRSVTDERLFKIDLKTHFFNLAFESVILPE